MAVSQTLYTQDNIEAVRHQLETVGYWDGTIIADGYSDAPSQLTLIDAKTNLGVTFPVPPDSMVLAQLELCVYADEATDNGHAITAALSAFRDGTANVSLAEEVNTANVIQFPINEFQADTAATAAEITLLALPNILNQGVAVGVTGVAASTNFLLGRMRLVCARKGGLYKKYHVTN